MANSKKVWIDEHKAKVETREHVRKQLKEIVYEYDGELEIPTYHDSPPPEEDEEDHNQPLLARGQVFEGRH